MNELIRITTSEQGSDVVSARELHEFLEVKSRFADWFKNRISKWDFTEGVDYVLVTNEGEGFSKNLEKGGRPEMDYAVTLDMAKELSMVERTPKGKEARQYFIEAEKALRQVVANPPALTNEQAILQVLSQQTQLMADTQRVLVQLRADVDNIMLGQRPAQHRKPLPVGPPTGRPAKASPLRQHISRLINDYCELHQAEQSLTYNYLYKRLFDVYGVNVYRLIRAKGESILDAVERYGHLDRLLSLITAELHYSE